MRKKESSGSPLESAAGAAGPHTTTAFELLANETRLSVLLALWEEYDPFEEDNAVAFSHIFERVNYDDPGNLRYHLKKLTGQFIHQHAQGGGYELSLSGMKLVRTVIAGAGVEERAVEPTEISQPCLICDAPTAISYRDGHLYWICTECEGVAPQRTETEGFMGAVPFEPTGLTDRTPDERRIASMAVKRREIQSMFDGFCPDCSGAIDAQLVCCDDHNTDGDCEHCGRKFAVWAHFQCRICKRANALSPKTLVLFHPAVIAFYEKHGLSIRIHADDIDGAWRIFEHMHDHKITSISEEPPVVEITVAMGEEEITLTFDETVTVTEVKK